MAFGGECGEVFFVPASEGDDQDLDLTARNGGRVGGQEGTNSAACNSPNVISACLK